MDVIMGFIFIILLIALYFLPTIIAYNRKYQNRMSVFVIDLFLGWTLIGWVIALALSLASNVEENKK